MSDESKECPFCAETIKFSAKICRYCQRDLTIGAAASGTIPASPAAGEAADRSTTPQPVSNKQPQPAAAATTIGILDVAKFLGAFLVVACLLIWIYKTTAGSDGSGSAGVTVSTPAPERPIEVILATADGNSADETKVNRYRFLLGQLALEFGCTKKNVADVVVAMQAEMQQRGVAESDLDFLESLNVMATSKPAGLTISDCAAFYAASRIEGNSREQAQRAAGG